MRRFQFLAVSLLAVVYAERALADDTSPNFNKDVAPILFDHCAVCHRPNNIGPFPLLSYQDARKRAKQLADVTLKRIMPPWMPHPEWGTFKEARVLSEQEIAVFGKWLAAGAPEGSAKDLPPLPHFKEGWQLGEPDMVLTMVKPFTVPAEGRDVYHHFVFPLNLTGEKYLKGIEVLPGNRKVTHHAVGILDTSGTAIKLAKNFDGASYPGNAPGFLPAGFTPGYAPGQVGAFFAPDEALTLKKGTDLVLQMHYSPSGKVETDLTRVGLYFTDTPPKRNLGIILLGSLEIDIAPGDNNFKRADSFKLPVDYEVRSIWSHMHLIGKKLKVWAELPQGTTTKLLWIDDWNFNWQDTYKFSEAFVLPKGTVIRAEFVWDNSAANPRNPSTPPKRVLNGEQSSDEMAGVIIGGHPVAARDELTAWIAVITHYLEVDSKKSARNR